MKSRTAIACALLVLMSCSWAGAQEEPAQRERAKVYFNAGAQAYALGQYQVAIQAFEQAYALTSLPPILFSMAQAERRQYFVDRQPEHLNRAIELFRRYVDATPTGGRRADAVQALSELVPLAAQPSIVSEPAATREQPTRVMVSSPTPDARISLNGEAAADAPFIDEVKPGRHVVRVEAYGYFPEEREFVAVDGALVALDVGLRERPARLRIGAPDGAQLYVDGRFQGVAPFSQRLELASGRHLISITKPGFVGIAREVELERGGTTTVRVALPRSTQRTVSLVMFGAGISTFVAGGVFSYFALDRDSAATNILERRGTGNIDSEDLAAYHSARTDRDHLRTAAMAAFGTGAALGVAGGLLYVLDTPRMQRDSDQTFPDDSTHLRAAPWWQPGSGGAVLTGQF